MEAGNCLNRGLARITQMTRIRGTGGNEGFPYYEQEGESQKSGIGVPSYQVRKSRESEFPPTKRDYPILTISAVVLFSRSLERSYPRSASSRKRVASAVVFRTLHIGKTLSSPVQSLKNPVAIGMNWDGCEASIS